MNRTILTLALATAAALQAGAEPNFNGLYSRGVISISKGGTLYVHGNVVNASASELNIKNSGRLYLTGDLINEASTLFLKSSSGVDTVSDGLTLVSQKTVTGAVYFVGCDTQYIEQRSSSQGILFNDIYHANHLSLKSPINVVGGLHFNGTHHVFANSYDIRLFEKDTANDEMCRGYLSGERNSSRIYGSGKVISITNDASRWWQLDSLGVVGIPNDIALFGAVRVVRGNAATAEVGSGSLARYFDLTINNEAKDVLVKDFTLKYMPSQLPYGGSSVNEQAFAIFQKNLNPKDPSVHADYNYFKRMLSSVDVDRQQVRAEDSIRLFANKDTARFTIGYLECGTNAPQVSFGADRDVCSGQEISLFASIANYNRENRGEYLYTYAWKNNQYHDDTLQLSGLQPDSTYEYSVEVEDRFGCRGWDTVQIRCHPLPHISSMAVGLAVQCESQPVALSAAATNGEEFLWTIHRTDSLRADMREVGDAVSRTLPPGRYDIALKSTSDKGCTSDSSATITVEKMPQVAMNVNRVGELSYALHNQTRYFSETKGAAWSINGHTVGTGYSGNPYTYTFDSLGAYIVSLTASQAACADTLSQTLSIAPYGTPAFSTAKSAYCAGEPIQYADSSQIAPDANGVSYLWRFGDGASSNQKNPIKIYNTAGAYSDTLFVSFANGRTAFAARHIQIHPLPIVSFGSTDSVFTCGSAYPLNAYSPLAASYLWSTGGDSSTLLARQTGWYAVTLTTEQGCAATGSLYVALSSAMQIKLGEDRSACGAATLNAGNPGSTYLWTTGDTTQSIVVAQSGSYGVRVTQPVGCSDSAGVSLQLNPMPNASLGARNRALCTNSSLTLAPPQVPTHTYRWSNGTTAPSLTIDHAGTFSVTVSDGVCAASDTVVVATKPAAPIDLGADRFLCKNEPTEFAIPAYLEPNHIDWYRQGDGRVDTTRAFVTAEAGIYSAVVTYSNGCTASDTVRVEHSDLGVALDFLMASSAELGDTVVFIDLSSPDVIWRRWSFDNGFSSEWAAGDGDSVENFWLEYAFYFTGQVEVTLTVSNGECEAQASKTITITEHAETAADSAPSPQPQSMKYIEIEEVKVFPNPTKGEFEVAVKLSVEADVLVELYSMRGVRLRQVPVRRVTEHTASFNIYGLQPDVYVVLVRSGSERVAKKIVLEK
jgi:PKD repeat protein